eukprot:scaffold8126_cov457-Prasinococcus_capsulatus_cf.AAC.1
MHRDPDSWTNPDTPQRPKRGWLDHAMPNVDVYSYRFYNVWIALSPLDPTGQVWNNPLVVLLPRNGGSREWAFQERTLDMVNVEEEASDDGFSGMLRSNQYTCILPRAEISAVLSAMVAAMRLVGKAIQWGNRNVRLPRTREAVAENEAPAYGVAEDLSVPELIPDPKHRLVTGPFMIFDSFDCWHGSGAWSDDSAFMKSLRTIDPRGRKGFSIARKSIEMRFRVRQKMDSGTTSEWSPFSTACRSGRFADDLLRTSEDTYDLRAGL